MSTLKALTEQNIEVATAQVALVDRKLGLGISDSEKAGLNTRRNELQAELAQLNIELLALS